MKINHQTRKSTAVFVILGVLMIPFQNCGKFEVPSANAPGSSTQSSTSTGGGSGSGGSGTGTNPPSPTPNPNPSPNPSPDLEQQRKDRCMALQSTPTIAFSSAAAVSINSGMGGTSGDTSATQAVTVDHKVSNLSAFNADACSSAINIASDIMQDATHIISITSGVDMSGNLLGSAQVTDKQAFGRAAAQSMSNGSAYVVSSATSNVTFNVTNMRQNTYNRCVSGTFPVRYRAEVKTYTQTLTSAPVWGTITLNNTCWTQSKLRGLNEGLESSRLAGLGTAVATDGSWAVTVATNELNGAITGTGAAYVYKANGSAWDFTQEIRIPDAARGDNLSAVALKGDVLVLTSRYRSSQGAAFVFRRNGNVWGPSYQTINPPVSQTDQGFGTSVSLDGTVLAIGAADYSSVAGNYDASGAVYIFNDNGSSFVYSKQIQIPSTINQAVGSSVSVSGNLVAIGAPQAVTKESLDIGHVYVYNLSNSTYTTVNSGIAAAGAKFGSSVSLLGNQLAVGSPGHSNSKGAAFYYPNYSGAYKSFILGGTDGDQQGTSTVLVSAGMYTGAPYEGYRGVSRAGAITFSAMSVITSANGQIAMNAANIFKLGSYETSSNSAFGWAIGVSGNNIVAGARIKSDPQNGSGAAYMFLKQ